LLRSKAQATFFALGAQSMKADLKPSIAVNERRAFTTIRSPRL
jgi:hypothetical protein